MLNIHFPNSFVLSFLGDEGGEGKVIYLFETLSFLLKRHIMVSKFHIKVLTNP